MDKIIGLGNALVDVLATLKDDTLLDEMGLPKGSMQLIDDAKLQQINIKFSQMKTHLATGGSAGNAILGLACLGAGTGFIGKVGNDNYGEFFRENLQKNKIEDKLLNSDRLPSGVRFHVNNSTISNSFFIQQFPSCRHNTNFACHIQS